MLRSLKNDSGVVLILTLLVISLIVALTLEFNRARWSDLHSATNLKESIILGCIARSGFDYALAVLLEDASVTDFDSLYEDWTDSEALSSGAAFMFDDGRLELRIEDHSGRIQINGLVKESGYDKTKEKLFSNFLGSEEFGLEPEEVDNIMSAIKDWIDSDDDVTSFGGAENLYYQSLEEPYPCKNAPPEFLEGLLLVRWITRDLFYGTDEKPGISAYLSTHGEGLININTADPLILQAVSECIFDQDMSGDWIEYRDNGKNDLSKYENYPGMSGMNSQQKKTAATLLTVSSTAFEIHSHGFKGTMGKRVIGMIERQANVLKTLSWKTE